MISLGDSLRTDARFGLRRLRKNRVTSAAAVLSLGLGIGGCVAEFRLIDGLLLRPLAVAHPERLYSLSRQGFTTHGKPTTADGWQYPVYRRLRDAVADRADLLAVSFADNAELTYRSDPDLERAHDFERAHVQYVSGRLFESFGIRPASGRLLTVNDDVIPDGHPVAVLSHDYWVRRFQRDPNVVGSTFRLGKGIFTMIGVAEGPFTGTEPGTVVDVFLPAMMHWGIGEPTWPLFRTFVHLRSADAAPDAVRERLAATLRAVNEEKLAKDDSPQTLTMQSASAGVSGLQKNYRLSLVSLGILVGLVLLLACGNVANLMTAQGASRAREMAVRVAIGAGRGRLAQMVLIESAWLTLFSVAVGTAFAWWSAPFVLSRINAPENPARLSLSADWRVLAFGLALALTVTLLFGLLPALRASSVTPAVALKSGEGQRRHMLWMQVAIALQTAFCVFVLFVAGLFVLTFQRLTIQANGFSPERLLIINTITQRHEPSPLWDDMAARLRNAPGVEAVAYADWPLLDGYSFKVNAVSIHGKPATDDQGWFMNISPGWFQTMGIGFVQGRDFRDADTSPGAAIVNESFARQFFGTGNPIGEWFEGTAGYMRGQRYQIVGVVRDARYRYLREPVLPVAYTPFNRTTDSGKYPGGTFLVRTSGPNPLAVAPLLRREITGSHPEFRIGYMKTQQELNELQTLRERLLARLAVFFSAVALLLAVIGLYGVLSYSVRQRRKEIGIRMAIGARTGGIVRLVAANTFAMVSLGAFTGLLAGIAGARYIEGLLYAVRPTEWGLLAGPSLTVGVISMFAALPVLLHATRIDPAQVLRAE